MQISLTSRSGFSHSKRIQAGFTLVELLISVAIIMLLSGVLLVRFSAFDSTTLLRSAAYEMTTSIREAQVYAVSVLGSDDPAFDYPFGVTFSPGASSFTVFQYIGPANERPHYELGVIANQTDVYTRRFERNIEISDVCVFVNSTENCNIDQLDISFQRPEFTTIFAASGFSENQNKEISSASIKLSTPGGSNVWAAEVGLLGHISVQKEEE